VQGDGDRRHDTDRDRRASRTRYRRRNLTLGLPLTTDSEASNRAWFEVALGKEPKLRFDRLPIKPAIDPGYAWPYALSLDIGDKVTVERTPQSTSAITSETIVRKCFVEAIEHVFTPSGWDVTYQLSPAQLYDQFFVLDARRARRRHPAPRSPTNPRKEQPVCLPPHGRTGGCPATL
jgi:hypothetical protein